MNNIRIDEHLITEEPYYLPLAEEVELAEAAYQAALGYALERKQGRSPIEAGTGTIIDHADVRRMLTTMKAGARSTPNALNGRGSIITPDVSSWSRISSKRSPK